MLKAGLYIIATPIGNLGDITLRALETLKQLTALYCEDTRVTGKLMSHYGIKVKLYPYHDFSNESVLSHIIERAQYEAIGLVSDAGTPLISDPGFKLVQKARTEGIHVESLPGACAAITALTLSALPSDRFMFCGFYDPKKASEFTTIDATLIFYEAPHRAAKTLTHIHTFFPNRVVSVNREITKLFEQSINGTAEDILNTLEENNQLRGEFVIILSPPKKIPLTEADLIQQLNEALNTMSSKEAIALVAKNTSVKKSHIYDLYLSMKEKNA